MDIRVALADTLILFITQLYQPLPDSHSRVLVQLAGKDFTIS